MFFHQSPIQSQKPVGPDIHLLRFPSEPIASQARPGQFVMIRPIKFKEPLLARPFSIYRLRENYIDILFKAVGPGTRQLAELHRGDILEVRGPLGRGFSFHPDRDPLLIAGGMGVAPLLFLAEFWKSVNRTPYRGSIKLFIGARTREELIGLKEFKKAGVDIQAVTEDGSQGEKGLVTQVLFRKIKKPSPDLDLFACGPKSMLKAIQKWALLKGHSCQLSLETHMACGLGACLGCVVAKRQEGTFSYVNVCQEGPVFEAHQVILE
jgi:dihydroorotate dehydrogenase electron transfer subunit